MKRHEECYKTVPLMITAWSTVFLEKLIIPQLVKKFPAFYGDQGSSPCSQWPTIVPILN
jgi:hypothetical protein